MYMSSFFNLYELLLADHFQLHFCFSINPFMRLFYLKIEWDNMLKFLDLN